MMVHEQGSAAWFAERAGKITASVLNDIVDVELDVEAVFKSGPRKGQRKPLPAYYLCAIRRIAAERITGRARRQVEAAPLQWGKDVEPVARAAYEARNYPDAIQRLATFDQHCVEYGGAALPNVWRSQRDLDNVEGDLVGNTDSLRFMMGRLSGQP